MRIKMSNLVFDENDFVKRVPKKILQRTKENMEVYNLTLTDAFPEAVRELAKKGTTLWKAWYYDDFREYVPCIYAQKYLDLNKYPLKYNALSSNHSGESCNEREKRINERI